MGHRLRGHKSYTLCKNTHIYTQILNTCTCRANMNISAKNDLENT